MLRHLKLKINKLMFFKCRWWEIIVKEKAIWIKNENLRILNQMFYQYGDRYVLLPFLLIL